MVWLPWIHDARQCALRKMALNDWPPELHKINVSLLEGFCVVLKLYLINLHPVLHRHSCILRRDTVNPAHYHYLSSPVSAEEMTPSPRCPTGNCTIKDRIAA